MGEGGHVVMDLINEFDKKLSYREGEHSHEYSEGREQGLAEGRALAVEYVGERTRMDTECSQLIYTMVEAEHLLRQRIDEARLTLARAVGLVVPGHRTLEELVTEVIEAKDQAHYDLEHHECEEECENCRWGYNDDCDECYNTAATVKRAIEILEELT